MLPEEIESDQGLGLELWAIWGCNAEQPICFCDRARIDRAGTRAIRFASGRLLFPHLAGLQALYRNAATPIGGVRHNHDLRAMSDHTTPVIIAIRGALSCASGFLALLIPLLSTAPLAADSEETTWDVTKEPWKQATSLTCAPMYSRVCETKKGAQSDTKCNSSELVAWLVDFRAATIQFIAPTGNQLQSILATNWSYHGQTMGSGTLEGPSSDISILGSGNTSLSFSYIKTKLGVDLIGIRFDAITFNGERYATYEQGTRCTAATKP